MGRNRAFYILLVLIVIFIILGGYFLFFGSKIKKNTSSQNSSFQNGKYSTIYHFDNQKPDTSKGTVEAKSEIKGQMVEILSQKDLIDTLASWGVFEKIYNLDQNGKNTKPVNKVVFILTNEEQKNIPLQLSNPQDRTSVDMYAKGAELDIKIYASKTALTHANEFFTFMALNLLYNNSHPTSEKLTSDQRKANYFLQINTISQTQPLFVVYQVGYK